MIHESNTYDEYAQRKHDSDKESSFNQERCIFTTSKSGEHYQKSKSFLSFNVGKRCVNNP